MSTAEKKLRKLRSGGYLLYEENINTLDMSETRKDDLLAQNLEVCKKDIGWKS